MPRETERTIDTHMLQLHAEGRRYSPPINIQRLQSSEGRDAEEVTENLHQWFKRKVLLLEVRQPRCPLRRCAERQYAAAALCPTRTTTTDSGLEDDDLASRAATAAYREATRTVSPSPQVNSSSLADMLKVATVVQQIMTEINGAVSELEKRGQHKIVLKLMKQSVQ
jgi:hypothetical protein